MLLTTLERRPFLTLSILACVACAVLWWGIYCLQSHIIESTAIGHARAYSEVLQEFRSLYTSEVVSTAKKEGLEVVHDYKTREGAIPLPATMTMLLGKKIGEHQSGVETHLYSPYPFPWRQDTGGLRDDYAKEAWAFFNSTPDKPFYRFEQRDGRDTLRYATADLMRSNCVHCHNNHPDTPKNDWKVGDVRGVLEVALPLDDVVAQAEARTRQLLVTVMLVVVPGLVILGLAFATIRRNATALERAVEKSTRALAEEVEDHKKTEKNLSENEQNFMIAFFNSSDATMLIEGETFKECNEKTVEMFRASNKEEVIATHPSELSPKMQSDGRLSFEKANEMIAIAFERGSNRFEWDHRRLDGEVFPAEVTLMPVPLFGKQMLYCVVKDITKRKQEENELRKLSAAVEQSPATVVITDTEGTIQYVNPRFTETTGYTAEEAIGQNPRILQSGKWSKKSYEVLWKTILAGKTWRGEFENKKKSGEIYWESASISPIQNAQGEITNFLAVKEDITQRKQQEAELAQAKLAAEAANLAKSDFLANMSHEIRTPMTAILGFAEVLLESGDLEKAPPERIEAAKTIKRNGVYLLGIINDILDLSKIEAGKMTVEHIACQPCRIVAEVDSLMRVRADAKGLPFNIEYIGAIPETIQTDPTRLRQILINLIGNAIKFTETGAVRLVTRFVDDGDEPRLQFDVIDTGRGMTDEQAGKLFQPFTQADTSTTRKFGGTGLGLTISKRFAEMLGGDITVAATEVGVGTTFRVTVVTGSLDGVKMLEDPMSATAVVNTGSTVARIGRSDLQGCRILLAEDGPDNQRLISFVLKKAGADVTVKENGKLALDAALVAHDEGTPFDVILMDMQMPVMDGYEATGLLRQKGYTGPIIALTAHAMASDREKCINAGCDDYATKPIDRKKLIETIQQYLVPAEENQA